MAISTSELKNLIARVKAAIPDLEQIVATREEAGEAQQALSNIKVEIAMLLTKRDELQSMVDAQVKSTEQAQAKLAENLNRGQATYNSRIEDMQRKLTTMEGHVAAATSKLESLRLQHADAIKGHEQTVTTLAEQARAAERRYQDAQEKVRGLHSALAGQFQAP